MITVFLAILQFRKRGNEMNKIKVLLVDLQNKNIRQIFDTLYKIDSINLIGNTDDLDETSYMIGENHPDIVLLGSNLEFDRNILSEFIHSEYPNISIIMVENEYEEDTMYKALMLGASDVIIAPFTSSKLIDSIYRSYRIAREIIINRMETSVNG